MPASGLNWFMPASGFNQFKPGKIEFMPASGINNAFNFSQFKPWFKPGGLNQLPTLVWIAPAHVVGQLSMVFCQHCFCLCKGIRVIVCMNCRCVQSFMKRRMFVYVGKMAESRTGSKFRKPTFICNFCSDSTHWTIRSALTDSQGCCD